MAFPSEPVHERKGDGISSRVSDHIHEADNLPYSEKQQAGMGSSTSSEDDHRILHTHDPDFSVLAVDHKACHDHSCTDQARSPDAELDHVPRMGLPGRHDEEEGSHPVGPSSHEGENGNFCHSSRDEGSDHDNHDDEGCSLEADHGAHNRPRREDNHDDREESENVRSAHVDALLESIPMVSLDGKPGEQV